MSCTTPPVFHRDIKPSNILVGDDATPVLIEVPDDLPAAPGLTVLIKALLEPR